MPNSALGDLIRSLGIHIEGALTPAVIASTLRGIDGRSTLKAEIGWRVYCKPCNQTISTHPRKKKGDVAWPRAADGQYEELVSCPKCGAKNFGNAEVVRHKLPA
jgi:uncharacterized protein with PIN domain